MKLSEFRKLIREEVRKVIKESKASAAIAKNKTALTVAIRNRLRNDEDKEAYEEVESLIIKTAIDAGLSKQDAEGYPWMEEYAIPGESKPASDLAALQSHLEDALNDPSFFKDPNATNTSPSTNSNQSVLTNVEMTTLDTPSAKIDKIFGSFITVKKQTSDYTLVADLDTKALLNLVKTNRDYTIERRAFSIAINYKTKNTISFNVRGNEPAGTINALEKMAKKR
jgi:hypothetical protein